MQFILTRFFALSPRQRFGLYAALGVFLVLSAFVFEYGFNAAPCKMCWWQRYAHWAFAGFAMVGVLGFTRLGALGLWLSTLAGLGIGGYHSLVQLKIIPGPTGCSTAQDIADGENFLAALQNTAPIVPCDVVDFTLFSLSLANWNALLMLAVVVVLGYTAWVKKSLSA